MQNRPKSLPCVRGGAERSEAEGLQELRSVTGTDNPSVSLTLDSSLYTREPILPPLEQAALGRERKKLFRLKSGDKTAILKPTLNALRQNIIGG